MTFAAADVQHFADFAVTHEADLAAIPRGDTVRGELNAARALEAKATRLGVTFDAFDVNALGFRSGDSPNSWATRCAKILQAHVDALGCTINEKLNPSLS